jgi:AraC-like DNA-binding protein
MTIAIFFLGYFGIKQQGIYVQKTVAPSQEKSHQSKDVEMSNRYKRSGLKKDEAVTYLQELLDFMKNEQPYLNGKLSLKDVADHLNISINHVFQIMDENLGNIFFDFVNKYRVEEVKRLIDESKHEQMTLLGVAYDSGFNSKSSFNSIFKKFTDTTRSEYINSLKK